MLLGQSSASCLCLTEAVEAGKRPRRGYSVGKKARYFTDDDEQDLAALMKRQRYKSCLSQLQPIEKALHC